MQSVSLVASPRDFVTLQDGATVRFRRPGGAGRTHAEKAVVLYEVSVQHRSVPPRDGCTRGEVMAQIWAVVPVGASRRPDRPAMLRSELEAARYGLQMVGGQRCRVILVS